MRVAIVSDTHVPSRAREIPDWVGEEVRAADHTVHAGDFDSPEAFETVRGLAGGDLTAVRGNLDPGSLDLPETASVEAGGVTFVVTHGTGPLGSYRERVLETVRGTGGGDAVGVSGHTHQVVDETVDGTRLLNPGSATGADPAAEATMMVATAEDGRLDVTTRRG